MCDHRWLVGHPNCINCGAPHEPVDRCEHPRDQDERRKCGRPPLTDGDTPARLRVAIPTAMYDALYERARQVRHRNISVVVREALSRYLATVDSDLPK
jgi:hypothetical protein